MSKDKPNKRKQKFKGYPVMKKNFKDFLMNEEGKITKKDIAKLGVSLAVLGMMMQPGIANAQHADNITGHFSNFGAATHTSNATHANLHTNHTNHANHSDGGWMC